MPNLLLIGDSLTQRAGGIAESLYPLLRRFTLIGSRGTAPAVHEGVGGSTWWDHLASYESVDVPAWCAANGTPAVVHILLGENDLALKTCAQVDTELPNVRARAALIVSRWQAVGATVWISHIPGPCQYDASFVPSGQVRSDWEYAVSQYNAAIDTDFPGQTIPQGCICSDWPVDDCFHPSSAGYLRFATAIARALGEVDGRDPV